MNEVKLLHRKDVEKVTSLKKSSIYRFIAAGTFPKPHRLSSARVAWRSDEVAAWIAARTGAAAA